MAEGIIIKGLFGSFDKIGEASRLCFSNNKATIHDDLVYFERGVDTFTPLAEVLVSGKTANMEKVRGTRLICDTE